MHSNFSALFYGHQCPDSYLFVLFSFFCLLSGHVLLFCGIVVISHFGLNAGLVDVSEGVFLWERPHLPLDRQSMS